MLQQTLFALQDRRGLLLLDEVRLPVDVIVFQLLVKLLDGAHALEGLVQRALALLLLDLLDLLAFVVQELTGDMRIILEHFLVALQDQPDDGAGQRAQPVSPLELPAQYELIDFLNLLGEFLLPLQCRVEQILVLFEIVHYQVHLVLDAYEVSCIRLAALVVEYLLVGLQGGLVLGVQIVVVRQVALKLLPGGLDLFLRLLVNDVAIPELVFNRLAHGVAAGCEELRVLHVRFAHHLERSLENMPARQGNMRRGRLLQKQAAEKLLELPRLIRQAQAERVFPVEFADHLVVDAPQELALSDFYQ